MAVVNTKATAIANADARPVVINGSYLQKGSLVEAVGVVAVAAADDDGSVFRLARIPSNARVSEILVKNTAITGGTVYRVGVYEIAGNGGAAVNTGVFATTVDMSTARTVPADVSTSALAIDQSEKRLWELLGLAADPKKEYDIALTATTVGTAAGSIAARVRYVV